MVRKEGVSWLLNWYAEKTRTTTTPIASRNRVTSRYQDNARDHCILNRTITAFITAPESRTPADESKAEHTPNVHTAGIGTAYTANRETGRQYWRPVLVLKFGGAFAPPRALRALSVRLIFSSGKKPFFLAPVYIWR